MCDGYFHVCEVPWRPEGAVDSLVLELEVVVICLTWCLEMNFGPLKEQYVLLTTELSLQFLKT